MFNPLLINKRTSGHRYNQPIGQLVKRDCPTMAMVKQLTQIMRLLAINRENKQIINETPITGQNVHCTFVILVHVTV